MEDRSPTLQALRGFKRLKEERGSLLLGVKWCLKGQGLGTSQQEPKNSSKKVPE